MKVPATSAIICSIYSAYPEGVEVVYPKEYMQNKSIRDVTAPINFLGFFILNIV